MLAFLSVLGNQLSQKNVIVVDGCGSIEPFLTF
jgi:hypothetical protein